MYVIILYKHESQFKYHILPLDENAPGLPDATQKQKVLLLFKQSEHYNGLEYIQRPSWLDSLPYIEQKVESSCMGSQTYVIPSASVDRKEKNIENIPTIDKSSLLNSKIEVHTNPGKNTCDLTNLATDCNIKD